jgi:hypothetical protein
MGEVGGEEAEMELNAYDYEKQVWVSGKAAIPLIVKQAEETLGVIDKPAYRRMMGYSEVAAESVKRNALRELEEMERIEREA